MFNLFYLKILNSKFIIIIILLHFKKIEFSFKLGSKNQIHYNARFLLSWIFGQKMDIWNSVRYF